jgi:hypothetical protein
VAADGSRVERVVGTWSCRARPRCFVPEAGRCWQRYRLDTPLRQRITCAEIVQMKTGGGSAGQLAGDASGGGAHSRHRHPSFILEIIGRSTDRVGLQLSAARTDRSVRHPIAVLHQPSCQQSRRSFLEPDIEQFNDLFADVCGMAQARQFVALQRRAGSRKQEIPRRLGFGLTVHGTLHGKSDVTSLLTISNSIEKAPVWKTVENLRALFRGAGARERSPGAQTACLQDAERRVRLSACSGCSGDYEDPDATSWTEDFTGDLSDDEESEEHTAPERFPVQRH